MTRNASPKKAATPVQASLDLGDTPLPDEPRCSNCKHYTGSYCALVLPPFIRLTEYVAHRATRPDFVCVFHKA